jgi:hypothetical protein
VRWLNEWWERVVADWHWQKEERRNRALRDATAGELRNLLRQCPICRGQLDGHDYAALAVTVLSPKNKERVLQLVSAAQGKRWNGLSAFHEFDPMRDAVQADALRCPGGQVVILIVRNPFELFEGYDLLSWTMLDHQQSRELETHLEQVRWRPLTWTYPS